MSYQPTCELGKKCILFNYCEVTAVAFGGETLEDLYVTTGIPKEDVEEDAGRLFVVRGLGVKGVPAFGFRG